MARDVEAVLRNDWHWSRVTTGPRGYKLAICTVCGIISAHEPKGDESEYVEACESVRWHRVETEKAAA